MSENYIKNIIHLYFGKHFSKARQSLFAHWLLSSNNIEKKENELRNVWDENPSLITLSTYHDWKKMQQLINKEKKNKFNWIKYAAVACIFILATAIPLTLFIRKEKPVENIEFTEVFVAYGGSRKIILPDSSSVWVNAGSLIVYPKQFDNLDNRTIYLIGEASFDVKKNPDKPFVVKTAHLDVEALGTVFTVQAYPTDNFTSTTLESGRVGVDVQANTRESSILDPGQQLIYSHLDQSVHILSIDTSMFEMTRQGYQIFENTSFPKLINSLERKYNVIIHYNAQKYAGNYYNVKFAPNESIEDVLNVLKYLTELEFKIKGNVIYIN